MKMIEKNQGYENYIQFIRGRPQNSLIEFLEQIGAKEVPGTNGMLWKLPGFSKETLRRGFKYLFGKHARDPRTMLRWINEYSKMEIEFTESGKLRPIPLWKKDYAEILREWIKILFKTPSG